MTTLMHGLGKQAILFIYILWSLCLYSTVLVSGWYAAQAVSGRKDSASAVPGRITLHRAKDRRTKSDRLVADAAADAADAAGITASSPHFMPSASSGRQVFFQTTSFAPVIFQNFRAPNLQFFPANKFPHQSIKLQFSQWGCVMCFIRDKCSHLAVWLHMKWPHYFPSFTHTL